jgi:NADP-dependent aldehyde dehydrogenase
MLYHVEPDVGLRWVSDRRVGAVSFTGGKMSGLAIKSACDAAGIPVYLEMSSINPVVILPGALRERSAEIVDQLVASCTAAAGQMCTSPGLVFVVSGANSEQFCDSVAERFRAQTPDTLLSPGVQKSLAKSVSQVTDSGATLVTGGHALAEKRLAFENTLLRITGQQFLARSDEFQTEMFGTSTLMIFAKDVPEIVQTVERLQGNLTGAVYSAKDGSDDGDYQRISAVLRPKVGRMMNDKMPTGVVVSSAMQHGGPYPATGHPGFTSVGIPAAIRRFAMLQCFDQVRQERLPPALRDLNPNGRMIRWIDGRLTTDNV